MREIWSFCCVLRCLAGFRLCIRTSTGFLLRFVLLWCHVLSSVMFPLLPELSWTQIRDPLPNILVLDLLFCHVLNPLCCILLLELLCSQIPLPRPCSFIFGSLFYYVLDSSSGVPLLDKLFWHVLCASSSSNYSSLVLCHISNAFPSFSLFVDFLWYIRLPFRGSNFLLRLPFTLLQL